MRRGVGGGAGESAVVSAGDAGTKVRCLSSTPLLSLAHQDSLPGPSSGVCGVELHPRQHGVDSDFEMRTRPAEAEARLAGWKDGQPRGHG